jgi:putative transcriptional regulator
MKSNDTRSVDPEPNDAPVTTPTDWAAVDALSEEEIHAAALADPDAQPLPRRPSQNIGDSGLKRIVNVKKLRERLSLTQEAFAKAYRIPVGTLRDWEQGRKFPDAPARAYLAVIDRDPAAVASLLGEAA